MVDLEARERIQALEARGVQRDREIADLSGRLSRLSATLEAFRAEAARRVDSPALPSNLPIPKPAVPSVPTPPQAPAGFASVIVADFPALFAEFRGKRFTLLWRGGRNGFGARDFHRRCDGHANTLTLIEDTAGNIFGGFTPVEWESRKYDPKVFGRNCYKADPSLKSFVFTLMNPHNFRARKFALKAEKKDEAIYCHSSKGPYFYGGSAVANDCNANTDSWTVNFGDSYANDTGLYGKTFFTGSEHFTVKEIEVFKITG
jgi:hypothetical protein